jgi:hypothetical protein
VDEEGLTVTRTKTRVVTVMVVEAFKDPTAAWMLAEPTEMLAAIPLLFTVAIAGFDELQVAVEVTSCVLPSL